MPAQPHQEFLHQRGQRVVPVPVRLAVMQADQAALINVAPQADHRFVEVHQAQAVITG